MISKRLLPALKKRPEIFFLVLGCVALAHAEPQRRDAGFPVFVASRSNPNEYSVFANNGWDGNWYVGYDTAWIQKLPPLPGGNYARAFIGAKLGRMKTLPPVGRPPVFNPIPGELWMALSSTTAWTSDHRLRLTTTEDIPLDGNAEYPLENAGESQWFWVEIPTDWINTTGDNYLALWSPTPELVSVSSAPILAAALGGKEAGTWIVSNLTGELPRIPKDPPGAALSFFQPAIALKLIPAEPSGASPVVKAVSWEPGTPAHPKPVITANVSGDSIERAWLEYLAPGQRQGDVVRPQWKKIGRPLWKAPYAFTIAQEELPQGKTQIRVAAADIWERVGISDAFAIEVSTITLPSK